MRNRTLKYRMRARARKLGIKVPKGLAINNAWGRPARKLATLLQTHYGYKPTGEPTWQLKWKLMPMRERFVYIAQKELGVKEKTANWSPRVAEYLRKVSIAFPAAWCAAFVTWCVREAGYKGELPTSPAWVPSWAAWARVNGYTVSKVSARKGDIITMFGDKHIGIVTGNLGVLKQITTIEGNTGDMVARRTRPFYLLSTVIRLP